MRLYVPEVMSLCHKLGLPDPPWFEEAAVRERVETNRDAMPMFASEETDEG